MTTQEISGLPESWAITNLGDISLYIQRGKSPQYIDRSELPVLNQKCIRWHTIEKEHVKYIHPEQFGSWGEERLLLTGDILWNSTGTGTIGRAAIYKSSYFEKAVVDSHVTIVRFDHKHIVPEYAFFYIASPFVQKKIEKMQSGSTNQVELGRSAICETTLPLAPINEQKRIVEKIEELFSELDKGIESLKTARAQLKVYRQSILKHAFEGKLTADWRSKRTDIDTWRKVSLEALGTVVCGQSPSVSEVNQDGKGILYVTGPEQWDGAHIEEVKWTEHPKKIAPDGSIFITVKGAGVGKLFPGKRCAIGRDIYAFCPNELASTEFIIYALRYSIDQVVLQAKGDIPGLSKNHILDHVIGLPSPKEQEVVVQTLDRIFSNSNELEREIVTQLQKSESLRQSILKKAFSGQLVAQDPADEPASVLLERIRAEKEKTSDKKPKTRRRAA